jgi:lysophospholipase L1-like esterase
MRQLFQYDPVIGYRFIPGMRVRVPHEAGGYLVKVNSSGFRSEREFAPVRDPARHRILLFGDSYTAGEGVSNVDRYSDQLERALSDTEIYNFGLPGSGTDQQYLIYREVGRHLEHDLVIIAVLVENIRRVAARYRLVHTHDETPVFLAKPYYQMTDEGTLELCNVPVPKEPIPPDAMPREERAHADVGGDKQWLRQAIGKLGEPAKEAAQRLANYQPLPEYNEPNNPAWLLMRAILKQWIAEIARPAVLVPIPLYHYVEEISSPAGYQARFAELAAETNVQLHDPLPDLHAVPKSERRRFRFKTDIHPTREGHRVLADSLRPVVEQCLGAIAQP